ncbi:hypothetical protein N9259_02200 [bacterium]|nr:hypothetical protein [bacterium]MDB4568370.1 hypothetical protein [Akkermansiaceae bacterium]
MKSMIKNIIICALTISAGFSEPVAIKGMAEVDLKDASGKVIPEKEAVRLAAEIAQLQAVENAIRGASDAIRQQYAERVGDSEERKTTVMNMVVDKTIQTEPRTNQSRPRMRVFLTGKIDMTALRDQLNSWPKIAQQVDYSDIQMALFYVVTKTEDTIKGGTEYVDSSESSTSRNESGSENLSENGVEVSEKVVETERTRVGLKAVESTDKVVTKIDVELTGLWATGLITQFNDKGFGEVSKGSDFEFNEKYTKDIAVSGKVSVGTMRTLVPEMREVAGMEEGGLIVIGSLNILSPTKDSVTGLWSSEAVMSAEVRKMPKEGRKIATVVTGLKPISKKSLGKTQDSARKSVLSLMAPAAADEIISSLKNKGIL